MSMRLPLATVLLLASVPLALPQDSSQDSDQKTTQMQGQIGYKSAQDADQRKALLLKDFKPVSMLHAPVHEIERAKFYVIDVHNHVNDAQGIDKPMPPQRVI